MVRASLSSLTPYARAGGRQCILSPCHATPHRRSIRVHPLRVVQRVRCHSWTTHSAQWCCSVRDSHILVIYRRYIALALARGAAEAMTLPIGSRVAQRGVTMPCRSSLGTPGSSVRDSVRSPLSTKATAGRTRFCRLSSEAERACSISLRFRLNSYT